MKKALSLLSIMLVAALVFAACDTSSDDGTTPTDTVSGVDTTPEDTVTGTDTPEAPVDTVAELPPLPDTEDPVDTVAPPVDTSEPEDTETPPEDTEPAYELDLCKDVALCYAQCPVTAQGTLDPTCQAACDADANPDAIAEYMTLNQCVATNCAQYQNDQTQMLNCIETSCNDVYYGCLSGDGSCQDLVQCLNGCYDAACQNQCVLDTTEKGQKAYNAIIVCLIEQCGDQPDPNEDPTGYQEWTTCSQSAQQQECATAVQLCLGPYS